MYSKPIHMKYIFYWISGTTHFMKDKSLEWSCCNESTAPKFLAVVYRWLWSIYTFIGLQQAILNSIIYMLYWCHIYCIIFHI